MPRLTDVKLRRYRPKPVLKHSWWADHCAPDARESFIAAAQQRAVEREQQRGLAEVRQLVVAGIGFWKRQV